MFQHSYPCLIFVETGGDNYQLLEG